MKNVRIIDFNDITDPVNHERPRGHLTPIESEKDVPFEIKRVYYLNRVPENTSRGFHAHKNLKQVLICVHGSVSVKVDDGVGTDIFVLSNPAKGLLIEGLVWREMFDFSPGSVLLVLASEYYDEKDYIREYEEFIRLIR